MATDEKFTERMRSIRSTEHTARVNNLIVELHCFLAGTVVNDTLYQLRLVTKHTTVSIQAAKINFGGRNY
jgi:hypothetical protein